MADLTKDVRKLLLAHWEKDELKNQLTMPEYFFEQVVIPRMDYLRRTGAEVPKVRVKKSPTGELKVFLNY